MEVLLVKSILETKRVWHYSPPLGLGYLATVTRNDHNVHILDCQNERMDFDDLKSYIEEHKPEVVGFLFYSCEEDSIRKSLKIVKEINPEIVTVVGGPHPSCAPEMTLEDIPDVDYIFVSEAEIGFPIFLNTIADTEADKEEKFKEIPGLGWRSGQEIKINSPKVVMDLDTIGFPSWDLLGLKRYTTRAPHGVFQKQYPSAPMFATRGCPFQCTYCAGWNVTGRKLRLRSSEDIIEEIKLLHYDYGIKEITIVDDNFTLNKKFAKEVCRKIIDLNLKLTFNCPNGVRIDSLDRELLTLMKKAGWYSLTLGIESGSQRILDSVKKSLSVDVIWEKLKLIDEIGFEKVGFFMLGFPTETDEDRKKTVDIIFHGGFTFITFTCFVPFPGTEAYSELQKKGKLPDVKWNDLFAAGKVMYAPQGISTQELRDFRWKTLLKFYLRPRTVFNILIRIRLKNLRIIFRRMLTVVIKK